MQTGMWDMRPRKEFFASQLVGSFLDNNDNSDRHESVNILSKFRPLIHLYRLILKITPKVEEGYRDDITISIARL